MRTSFLVLSVAVLLAAGQACTVSQQSTPGVSGPSELAMSLRLTATPDTVIQDGNGTSKVKVTAFDAGGTPIAVDVQLSLVGAGTLSSATLKTGTDQNNPAFVIYTPPVATTGAANVVTINGTVIASNSVNNANTAANLPVASPQVFITIRPAASLVASAPSASFTASPFSPAQSFTVNKLISFDASASCGTQLVGTVCPGTSAIVSFVWNFGDNTPTASGVTTTHVYTAAGTYTPTLTITNDKGLIASATQTIALATVTAPTASFVFSPTTIRKNLDTVQFNAAASTAAAGHSIVLYTWNFGDSTSATSTGPTTSHLYATTAGIATTNNIYVVTLTVTDDVGQSTTSSGQNVTVTN